MKLNKTFVPAAVVLLCSSNWVIAEDQAMDPANPAAVPEESATAVPEFGKVDADKNGAITTSEAAAVPALIQQFNKIDKGLDGQLTTEEYAAIVSPSGDEGS